MTQLPDDARKLLDDANHVVVGTTNRDGSPHTSVLWATHDGDDLLLSTVEGRQKHKNWLRDPRVSVLILDQNDPYSYIEVRGTLTMTRDGGPELINQLSQIYTGVDYTGDIGTDNVRLVVRVTPTRVHIR